MSIAFRSRMKAIKRGQYDFTAQNERHKRQGRPLVTEDCPLWHPPKQRRHRGGEDV